jgi:hypothetical protein
MKSCLSQWSNLQLTWLHSGPQGQDLATLRCEVVSRSGRYRIYWHLRWHVIRIRRVHTSQLRGSPPTASAQSIKSP